MALTFVPMLVALLIGLLLNNARLGDVRDLLRAEIKGTRDLLDARLEGVESKVDAELEAVEARMERDHSEMLHRFADLDSRIGRIEISLGKQR